MEKQMLDRSVPPAAAPMEKIPFPEIHHYQLDNGVPVQIVQFGTQEILELNIVFPAGRSFEPSAGISSFTGQMMQEGSQNYTGLEFARELDLFGAYLHVDMGYESGSVCLTSLVRHMASTIPLAGEMLLSPLFPERELEKLRDRTVQHLDVEEQKTGYTARKEFNSLLFGQKHPYGRSTGAEEVKAVQNEDLKAFHERNFNLVNGTIIAVGRFDNDELLGLLNAQFGSKDLLNESLRVDRAESQANDSDIPLQNGFHYFEKAESMQATVRVGHVGFKRQHPDYYPMQLVNTILGGYFGSRLMKNIREDKGYTYGIGSAWLGMKYNGIFLIQTDVGNEYIQSTFDEINKELRRLIDEGVTEEELALVKNYMLGRSASGRETPSQIISLIKNTMANEIPISELDNKFDIIQAVSTADVQRLASKYFQSDNLLQVVCGKMENVKDHVTA